MINIRGLDKQNGQNLITSERSEALEKMGADAPRSSSVLKCFWSVSVLSGSQCPSLKSDNIVSTHHNVMLEIVVDDNHLFTE